jgi:hypothetical protein
MAKDTVTHNGIEYFGIATRREINKLLGSEEFAPPFDQCLTKELAAKCTSIKVTDNDTNPKKLLRYDSIELANRTITLKIYNNSAYALTLYSISIKFTIDGTAYEQSPDVRADTVAPGDTKNITITNYREKVPPEGNATLQLSIDCFYYNKPSGAATVRFYVPGSNNKFDIYVGPYANTEINASKTLTNSGTMSLVNNTLEWVWFSQEINTYWASNATEIQFEVKIS